jgi:hypothetical protein
VRGAGGDGCIESARRHGDYGSSATTAADFAEEGITEIDRDRWWAGNARAKPLRRALPPRS